MPSAALCTSHRIRHHRYLRTVRSRRQQTPLADQEQRGHDTVVAAGGGPAGVTLGLLLSRAGIDVVVLEKHADFLRDFRGDTIHPSTLELIEELGLTGRFEQIPHGKLQEFAMGEVKLGSMAELGIRYPYIAIAPQWDFLTMLAEHASATRRSPSS
jgi:2-polyprenyl-6-methoxyphenol hydroxylase-like FAD-dependent oxidoreductase